MPEPIAVVGSSCRFPGGASTPSKLWQLLKNPRDVLSDIPKDRLGLGAFYHEDGEHHGSTNVVAKAYLLEEDPRLFDGPFFNINPMEADAMDPQQRLLLESVYECIESAGYPLDKMRGSATSVYVGCMTNDYSDIQGRDLEIINRYHGTGSTRSILSNRISYVFDLRGPSVTMDTACSSSLAALHFAVQSLRNGESTSSIVGGVNLIFDSTSYISESKLHMLSPTSRSSMWDDSADGYARGEGVSALMLKTLSQAVADGDHIECIIRETGMNSDGRTTGMTMPSGDAQATLIRDTYARAGLDLNLKSDRPQYFEAHGTGTMAGDPQEARGIYSAFFGQNSDDSAEEEYETKLFCGSIKTVIGHLEGCAGLAGLLKASLAIQNGVIPPNLLFQRLNPDIKPFYHRLQVPTEALPWPSGISPRRASVNSFGFGGTNCHAIIEQYVPPPEPAKAAEQTSVVDEFFAGPLVLSAYTGNALAASIESLADMLEDDGSDLSVEKLSFFTQTRRSTFPQRIYFPGGSRAALIEALRPSSSTTPSELGVRAPMKLKWHTPGILGVFTGQGAQWATMGRDMVNRCHLFRQSIDSCEAALQSLPDGPAWSLKDELLQEQSKSRLHEAALSQPLCTAIQIALVDTLKASGVTFRGVVGHSSGEIAATYAAGLLSAADAMRVAYYRGLHAHLAQGKNGQRGAMLAVGLGIDDAEAFCKPFEGRLSVAASNSPTSTTLSGDEDVVQSAKATLDEKGTFARLLKVDTAYHSSHMLPCAKPYLESLKACNIKVLPQNEECIWISSVHGHAEILDDPEDLDVLADQYWVDNMCQPVLFSEAIECSLWRAGPFDLAIEVGAHPALKGPATQTITAILGANAALPYTATLQRGQPDVQAFSASLGSLWTTLGTWVDFNGWRRAYLGPDSAPVTAVPKGLPGYKWTHDQIFWKESRISARYRLAERAPHELLGRRAPDDSDHEMRWRNILKVSELPWTRGHVFQRAILFPTTSYIALAIEAAVEIAGLDRIKLIEIRDLVIPRALVLEDNHTGVETVFSVRRQPTSDATFIEAEFACHSSVNGGALEKNCGGRVVIELFPSAENLDEEEVSVLPTRCSPRSGTTSIEGEAYYQAILNTTGLDYTGLFRGMKHIRRSMGFSSAVASWPVEEVGNRYLVHPGLLDVALQAILAAFVNPTRIPIRGSLLPSALARLVFDPHTSAITEDGKEVVFESDCFLTTNTVRSVEGDIHVFGPSGKCMMQVEGFRMDNWTEPSAKEDRPVFSRLEYKPDLFYANGNDLTELNPDDAELRLIEAVNRASFYYLRAFFSSITEAQMAEWTWDRQAFCKAAKQVLQLTADGKHPVARKSWLNDTAALMAEYKQTPALQNQPDMRAIHVAGEHLAQVMAGEERALEIYLREGVWAPLYSHGRYQVRLNKTIADLVRSFAHRYPRANFLEVGAGSAGTTVGILDQLGGALGQYTFTDISAGFFEKARERLAKTEAAAADRVVYKVLDLERDPQEQGFEPESQDVIIAANVLHATADLKKSVESVRRLLKPGGYLFMLEVTGEYLEGLLLMGPLEGWWLGNREGKASQPGLTLSGWDDLLRETGFTGVDKHQSDIPDSATHAVSVVVSQATDTRIEMLREPLEYLDELPVSDQVLIIGGESLATSKTIRSISQQVSRFAGRVQVVQSVDKIDLDAHTSAPTAVIALCELERPFFADPVTESRLKKLQALFAHATDVLWVTTGHLDEHDPSSAMMIGLCRTMVVELEHLNLQFLNTTTKGTRASDARLMVEAFIRLKLSASDSFAASPILWSNEPELTVSSEEEVLIPRLLPDVERNDRLNSAARHITKEVTSVDVDSPQYTAVTHNGHLRIEEDAPWLLPAKRQALAPADTVTIQASLSVTVPGSTSAVLITGYDQQRKRVLALVGSHSTQLAVPAASVLYLKSERPYTAKQLRTCAQLILAQHVLAAVSTRAAERELKVIVHGASAALADAITHLAAQEHDLVFTESTSSAKTDIMNAVRLHPRSSNYIIQRALPPNVGFVVDLTKGEAVGSKLTSIFPGVALDLDNLVYEGKSLLLSELESSFEGALAANVLKPEEAEANVPAHLLSNAPASTLNYPAVVDWSIDAEHPLQVTVKPIDGRGLFSPDKSYLMVSLVSTLGRSICRWMIENGARHIALASRSAKVDPQWLEEMAQLGANVRVYRMDVSDRESVRSTVATMRAEMPPIAGVANAALVLRDRLFLDMELADMTEVLAPKVDGSFNLHEEFDDPTLDFFILFSTLSCVIGNAGQSNYDAASLYQVMLAKQRRQKGLPASVMEVGCVADVGYVAERGQSLFDKLARTMKLPLAEADVHQLFAEAVAASPVREGEVVDSTTAEIVSGMGYYNYTPNTPFEAHPPWFNNRLAAHYVREERGSSIVTSGADGDNLSVAAQLDATTTEDAAASVLTRALAARVETMLQMASGNFKVDASLLDVGIDSLLAVELRTWFLKEVHVDVPVLKILGGDSGEAICAFAASQYLAEKNKTAKEPQSAAGKDELSSPEADSQKDDAASVSGSDEKQSGSSSSSDAGDSAMATSVSTMGAEEKEDINPPQTLQDTAPMTHAQARMWIADHVSSDQTQNNNVLIYDLNGFVNVTRLRRAVATVVAHHSGLHTCFFQDATNTPLQGRLETPLDCFKHISSSNAGKTDDELICQVEDELSTRKWRLQRGEALEVILVSHASDKHTLLIGYHHIAMDGSAWRTFFRDLHMAYQGIALQTPGRSLTEIATNQTQRAVDGSSTFWKEQLSPIPDSMPLLPFASTKSRPHLDGFKNHTSTTELPGPIVDRINGISRSLGVTAVNFYLAAVQYLLARITHTPDICIGVTDSGRDAETAETVGFFLNLLPFRLRKTDSQSFADLIQQVNSTYREARKHSSVPFDEILEGAGVSRDPTCTPLFQVGFDIRPGQSAEIPLGNCKLSIRDAVDSVLPYDITFCVVPMPTTGPSYVQVHTRTDLYSPEATELLAHMYITLLESVVQESTVSSSIERLQIYPSAGIQKALDFGSPKATAFEGWPSTITARFDQIASDHATTAAIRDVSGFLSYAELLTAITSLSKRLLPHRGQRIAVLCEPQREWIVGMLAIFRIGATFISLDATLPPERLVAMINASEATIVLCHAATKSLSFQVVSKSGSAAEVLCLEDTDPDASEATRVENLEDTSKASLILCTSGTTGVPKAILLSSRGFLNFLGNQAEIHGVQEGEVILQKANLGFDMAIAEALLALAHGGTLIIAPQASRGDPVALTDLMVRENVSLTFACPTEYLMWLHYSKDKLSDLTRWRLAHCGGEKVPEALRREMQNHPCSPVFADAYGPTEISICVTMEHDERDDIQDPLTLGATSVGRPLANVGAFILDPYGHVCPPGVPGEICVTGHGVALGYVDADATAKSFIEDFEIQDGNGATRSEGRMYRTGDRGVWRANGTLGYLGRMVDDTVVKIRGLRTDLTDVENAVLSHGAHIISDVAVTFHQQNEDAFLVAHVVPNDQNDEPPANHDGNKTSEDKNGELEASMEAFMQRLPLPRHMRPSRVVILLTIPMTANAKIDRRKLAQTQLPPRSTTFVEGKGASKFTTLKEVELHLLWKRILDRADIPRQPEVDFWAMGGSSLHLVKLQAAIRTDMFVDLSIRDLFMHSTIGSMAELISDRVSDLPARETINWDQETRLPDDLKLALRASSSDPTAAADVASCKEILLTGADTFLGGHILQSLLHNPSIRRVHCLAVPSLSKLPAGTDVSRIVIYEGSNLHQKNFALSEEMTTSLLGSVDRIIVAGSHGHCLHNYASLRQTNVASTKTLATWASRYRLPIHFVSSSRVTLLAKEAHAALPPVSVKTHPPKNDGSEGLTASKWACEVFLENFADEASKVGGNFSITIHRPCSVVGDQAPSDDALNSILRFSALMSAVPQVSKLPVTGFFDFAPVEQVAASIAEAAIQTEQPPHLRFRHHSGGVEVRPAELKEYMEKFYGKEFEELELEQWIVKASELGIEPMIAIYLRAVFSRGQQLIFPFMGASASEADA
ncbi:hypothetical protein CKM354_000549200 [Cercospora kikuchii]|uniref:Polyketide synthase n=1 Tax=Cercospora kikuchii TaxID=84275 RepID=A0A9P3CHR8_9PEZI|nr:uncharacterized protein CKM354_000549200 [Cercospora kikuchii]GIZ42216.1 hypothetical protein CKM354_000549200 [Cercospora kikuchii]